MRIGKPASRTASPRPRTALKRNPHPAANAVVPSAEKSSCLSWIKQATMADGAGNTSLFTSPDWTVPSQKAETKTRAAIGRTTFLISWTPQIAHAHAGPHRGTVDRPGTPFLAPRADPKRGRER